MFIEEFEEYIVNQPENRHADLRKLIDTITKHVDSKASAQMQYKMPSWVVPFSVHPDGYHCTPSEPLPYIGLANRKNYISFYHMGLYMDSEAYKWFHNEAEARNYKLTMGKSCWNIKKVDDTVIELLQMLLKKQGIDEYLNNYLSTLDSRK